MDAKLRNAEDTATVPKTPQLGSYLLESLVEVIQHTDEKLLRIMLSPPAKSWVPLPKDGMKSLRGNIVKLSKPHIGHQTA